MGFTKLDQLLSRSVKKSGIGRKLAAAKTLEDFQRMAVDWYGPDALKKIKPIEVRNGALVVACLSSVLSQRLRDNESRICRLLTKGSPECRIDRLKIID